jgi:hypothetical protein
MKTFSEFLKEQADQIRSRTAGRNERQQEWFGAVRRLYDKMYEWLYESDQDHILNKEQRSIEISEPSLGHYRIDAFDIWVGDQFVRVEPVAFDVIGAGVVGPPDKRPRGRVDIKGASHTYKLYRFVDDSGREDWYIIDDRTFEGGPFTREAFDAALVSLFQ